MTFRNLILGYHGAKSFYMLTSASNNLFKVRSAKWVKRFRTTLCIEKVPLTFFQEVNDRISTLDMFWNFWNIGRYRTLSKEEKILKFLDNNQIFSRIVQKFDTLQNSVPIIISRKVSRNCVKSEMNFGQLHFTQIGEYRFRGQFIVDIYTLM